MTHASPLKARTAAIQKSMETGERSPLQHFDTRTYIQHNPALGDGFAALLDFIDSLPAGTTRVRPLRTFEDGDISFAHLEYLFEPLGALVGFEVHRWSDDRIVEHWDNLAPLEAYPGDERPWATAGPTEVRDPAATERTRRTAADFADAVLIGGDAVRGEQLVSAAVADHGGTPEDGRAELLERLLGGSRTYSRRHRVLCDGEFALVMLEGTAGGLPSALYHLLRVERGEVLENWEVVEAIPPESERRNANGKF